MSVHKQAIELIDQMNALCIYLDYAEAVQMIKDDRRDSAC